jgi:DNA-binding NtrC family response regulator
VIGLVDLCGTRLVAAALERGGPTLRALASVGEAARALAAHDIEALIVEARGTEPALRELLEPASAQQIPVLLVVRERGMSTAVNALRSGASDVLHAPFEYEALQDALGRLLDVCVAGPRAGTASSPFVTQDRDSHATLELARCVAASDATVLILGESGTGKEVLARLVHESSPRRRREMISVNCAALPPGLLESELFGHERGSFTGAFARAIGKFELAEGTTLLLDEIGELEPQLQAKLLRVIQEKQVQRLGAPRPVSVDFRLIATTNRDLATGVRQGTFREDLFYRLNVLPLRLKALRERPDDVPLLISHFLARCARHGPSPAFAPEALEALRRHAWPGNVRELENVVERLAITHSGRVVQSADLGIPELAPAAQPRAVPNVEGAPFRTLREMERWWIVATLARLEGNRTRAARELGISLRTLRNKIHEYSIVEPETLPRGAAPRPLSTGRA